MTSLIRILAVFCAFVGFSGLANAESCPADPGTLRTALLPDENASTIIKNNKPLADYLEQATGKKVKLIVTADYSSMIEAMRHCRLELAYFGALSYVLARRASKIPIEAFAALSKRGELTYNSVLITYKGSGVKTLEDVRGKDFGFGDKASTSSSLIPTAELLERGLKLNVDYKGHYFGAHDAVAINVQNHNVAAGGLSKPIFETLVDRGVIDMNKVSVLLVSKAYPNYPWTMRTNMKPELIKKIKDAFYTVKDKKILKYFKAEGFGAVSHKNYEIVENTGLALGLIKK